MNKTINTNLINSFLLSLLLGNQLLSANSNFNIDINSNGTIHNGYIFEQNTVNGIVNNTFNLAFGGNISLNMKIKKNITYYNSIYFTKSLNHELETTPASSYQKILNNNQDFIYFGENYFSIEPNKFTNLMIGYQSFDLPFFNTDELFIKNSYQSLVMEYIGIDNLYLNLGYINKMAGNINNNSITVDYSYLYGNPINSNIGQVSYLYLNTKFKNIFINGFFANINNIANTFYINTENIQNISDNINLKLKFNSELSMISEISNSGYSGFIYGLKGTFIYNNLYSLSFAYNNIEKSDYYNNINITRGQSPYLTSTSGYSIENNNDISSAFNIGISKETFNYKLSFNYFISSNYVNNSISATEITYKYKFNKNFNFYTELNYINQNNGFIENNQLTLFSSLNYQW